MLQSPAPARRCDLVVGVGIDSARYGHVAHFSRDGERGVEAAAAPLSFAESPEGYLLLRGRFERLLERHPDARFVVRVDAAGQYAANLAAELRRLPFPIDLSFGDSRRNGEYRKVHFPRHKSDKVDSRALARYAVVERPGDEPAVPERLLVLREIASRLQSASRHRTRVVNQLHNLLSRVFPELEGLSKDLRARWVLRLLAKRPTAASIAAAAPADLARIPFLDLERAQRVVAAAKTSVASFRGRAAGQLVLSQIRLIRAADEEFGRLKALTAAAWGEWNERPPIDSIRGIGQTSAAILAAKIVSIERFRSASALTAYFGVYPTQRSSGVSVDGEPKRSVSRHMSRQGNDLVRSALYNCARAAVVHNPACRRLHLRLRARGTTGNRALGHVMRKLLHLVFAVWKSGRPFDPELGAAADPEPAIDVDVKAGSETPKAAAEKEASRPPTKGKGRRSAAGRKPAEAGVD